MVPEPIPGPYAGQTDELSPRRISFQYLGGAVRDLVAGGKPIVNWIPVRNAGASAELGDAEVHVYWDSDRQAHGSISQRRGDRVEVLEFHARQRFRE